MPQRLDAALFAAGLARSRSHARRIVEEGRAQVNGVTRSKASTTIAETDALTVAGVPHGGEYVSRAAHKLIGAFDLVGLDVAQVSRALDVGSSTGGFTDVLLRRGVHHVVAVDVGRDQLAPALRSDPRVTSLEGTDARNLTRADVGPVGLVVSDVSFISLTHLVPTIASLVDFGTPALLMVKPQFEVGRKALPKSGVVTDPSGWTSAIARVAQSACMEGLQVRGVHPSAQTGQDGNREFFLHLERAEPEKALSAVQCGMIDRAVAQAAAHGHQRKQRGETGR